MKHSKFFLVAGALVLGIMSIYATKSTKKFAAASKAYARTPYLATIFFSPGFTSLTTVAGFSLQKAKFAAGSGPLVTLRTSASGNAKTLYFKP